MESCQHIFTASGADAKCVRCGTSLLSVQATTTRPSPAQELRNKLRDLEEAEDLAAPPPSLSQGLVTHAEFTQVLRELGAALDSRFEEQEKRLKAHVEERLLAPTVREVP